MKSFTFQEALETMQWLLKYIDHKGYGEESTIVISDLANVNLHYVAALLEQHTCLDGIRAHYECAAIDHFRMWERVMQGPLGKMVEKSDTSAQAADGGTAEVSDD